MLVSRRFLALVFAFTLLAAGLTTPAWAGLHAMDQSIEETVAGEELPTPTVTMRSLADGRLLVTLGPNLPGTDRWRYRLEVQDGDSWVTVTTDSYRDRGYFYTQGRGETFRHEVGAGTYRVSVMAGQHGHDGVTTDPYDHQPPDAESVVAGHEHVCILDTIGRAWCLGENGLGQLGNGGTTDRHDPAQVSGDHTFQSLTAADNTTCGLDDSGAAWCWGANSWGQLGDDTKSNRKIPVRVIGSHTFTDLDTGGGHTCAIDDVGQGWCWGVNSAGQLGDGTTTDSTEPVAVGGSHTFVGISSGGAHTCAIDEAQAAWCWGFNSLGAVGDGTSIAQWDLPASVSGGHAFPALSSGGLHNCGITDSADAWCWGANTEGELGDGSRTTRKTPVLVNGDLTLRNLATGHEHTCAIDDGAKAWCWGQNDRYQLGDGTRIDRDEPVPVASGEFDFRFIAAGTHLSAGVLDDRTVVVWGAVDDWSHAAQAGRVPAGSRILR